MKLFKKNTNDQSLVGHLTEVRMRIILSILAFLITSIVTFQFTEPLVMDLIGKASGMQFVFIQPAELFMTFIKIALTAGLVVALPFLLFQLWIFVRPGLKKNEKKAIIAALTFGLALFTLGMVFAYLVVLPMTTSFFMGFKIADIPPMVSFSSYFDYAVGIVLSFGAAFEFPILMVILVWLGVVKTSFMAKNRKFVILIILIVAAILTPPDVISQVLLTLPLLILFELGLILSRMVEKRAGGKASDEKNIEKNEASDIQSDPIKDPENKPNSEAETETEENALTQETSETEPAGEKAAPEPEPVEEIQNHRQSLQEKFEDMASNGIYFNPDDEKF